MYSLNNKEIVEILFFILFILFIFINRKTRPSALNIIKILLSSIKILIPIIGMILYTTSIAIYLNKLGLWQINMIYTAVLWLISTGFVMLLNINKAKTFKYFKKVIKETIITSSTIGLLVFVIDLNDLSLLNYLFLIPTITFLSTMSAVAKLDKKNKQVYVIIDYILSGIGSYLLISAVLVVIRNFEYYSTLNNFILYLLPTILTILFIPFIYILSIYSLYESSFVSIEILLKRDADLIKKTKFRLILKSGINIKKLNTNRSKLVFIRKNKDIYKYLE